MCLGVPSGEGCWKAIIYPPIPYEGIHSCTFVLQSDSNKCIYLGVKCEEYSKTEDQWLGHLETEWSFNAERATRHHQWNENRYAKPLKKNDRLTITLNRFKGTLSYRINNHDYGTAF